VTSLLERAGIRIGGAEPHDIRVHDSRFYARVLRDGSLGLGESYVDGWWDADAMDEVVRPVLEAELWQEAKRNLRVTALALAARLRNPQSVRRAAHNARTHYELGLDLFRSMLDRRLTDSCGYWKNACSLDEAQEAKLTLSCRKLGLREGMTLLDVGCGWGSLIAYAAERYGVRATGVTVSPEQAEVARSVCRGLPVEVRWRVVSRP
jgi:cyclopropane-fatty-acyl-phospholipid synthase